MKVNECKPPSDMIWENRGVLRAEQYWRGIIVLLLVMVITFVVYMVFVSELTVKIYLYYRGYPPGVVCSNLIEAQNDTIGYAD